MKKYLLFILLVNVVNVYSQYDFQNSLEGIWKLKSIRNDDNTSINFTEYLKFVNNEIYFFKIESGKEKLLEIKKYEIKNKNLNQIKFENGEVWTLWFRDANNEIRLIWENNINKNGDFLIHTDDRGVIKNKELRKIELEKEIFTYYIKIK
jgi:hypothetical protein